MKIGLDFGITLYEFAPQDILTIARRAEELGYESIWIGDHLVLPTMIPPRDPEKLDTPTSKVTSPLAAPIFEPDAPMLDMFVLFGYMAAVTSRIKFGTDIYILPLRHPLVTARAVGTLDVLSGGRTLLGAGLGWLPGEFEIAEVDFATRGRRMDECIEVLRRVWTEDAPEFQGRCYTFGPLKFEPKPVQSPCPPILIGGESDAALRRAARLGDGWCARFHSPESLSSHLGKLTELRRQYGRADAPFETVVRLDRAATPEEVCALERAGADRLRLNLHKVSELPLVLEEIERFAERVLARV